jgi:ribosomal-protein-alanine N-acetyltransferase
MTESDPLLPVLHTARLRLTIAGPDDAQACARFNRENAAFLAPWEPRTASIADDVKALREVRRRAVAAARAGSSFSFGLQPAGAPEPAPILGWLNFTNVVRGVFQACTMGYNLDRRLEGHGYMSEAARAGIEFAFGQLRLHRIMAAYMPHNQRSAALLRRLGFTVEGTAKSYLFIGGQWRDHVLTSLINPEPT